METSNCEAQKLSRDWFRKLVNFYSDPIMVSLEYL